MTHSDTLELVYSHARETALLASISAVLEWDERTYLPAGAAEYRAEQTAYLAGLVHERKTDPRLGEWLAELADSELASQPNSDTATNIARLGRLYERQQRLPKSLVEELTRSSILGQHAWESARKDDSFSAFEPVLAKSIELKRQQADALGYEECRYDALLDEFEPFELTSRVGDVLQGLRDELVPFVQKIAEAKRRPDESVLNRDYPVAAQDRFGRRVAADFGFDFNRGRLDETAHPFCTGMGPSDCRITTRYDAHYFPSSFFSILHEAGHGIYDQGLRADQYGLPSGEAISLGIHESQSRMWENQVGRSLPLWRKYYADAQREFPQSLGDVALEDFHFAINAVQPSLVRVEADEVTYNLHIFVRFELEQALINDDLPVSELPSAWNEKYQAYLGMTPPSDADGVLQDIHWSAGLMGYFATYTLGNLYAAQFFDQANRDLGGLHELFAQGEFEPLRGWLRSKIHEPGQCFTAKELVQEVTGQPLSHGPLMQYLRSKYESLYDVT